MNRRSYLALAGTAVAGGLAGCSTDGPGGSGGSNGSDPSGGDGSDDGSGDTGPDDGESVEFTVETVADGFTAPWSVAPLPDESALLVTERVGELRLVDPETGDRDRVPGAPTVAAAGQGGLLDIAFHPDFPEPNWVYLTYAAGDGSGASTTHLGRGRLDTDAPRLRSFERLHAAEPYVESNGHFGSRVVFGPDRLAYVSVGDRQFKDFGPDHVAQDRTNELGCTLRLAPDGSVPDDNPFVDDEGADAVFSYGHRNAQGMAVHPETGAIWQSEFGEQDGDELNRLERGANFGWPVADEGCTYGGGDPIGVPHDERDDVVAPMYSWPCPDGGFPPSGMTFYDGDAFPAWQGDLLVGGLASQYLARLTVDGDDVAEGSPLLADRGWRVRDAEVGPDTGHLYVVVDGDDAPIARLVPDEESANDGGY